MGAKPPPDTTRAAIETGVKKAKLRWDRALVASFLAGAYIALFVGLAYWYLNADASPPEPSEPGDQPRKAPSWCKDSLTSCL